MPRLNYRRRLAPDGLPANRRSSVRFALELGIRYVVTNPTSRDSGVGKTIDISSSGIRFIAERPLRTGLTLDIAIDWPAALDETVPLQLAGRAVVVRSKNCETAVRLVEHQFKTRSRDRNGG